MTRRNTIVLQWGGPVVSADGWNGMARGALLAPRSGRVSHVVVQRGLLKRLYTVEMEGAQLADNGTLMLTGANPDRDRGPARGSVPLTAKTVVRSTDSAALPLQGLALNASDLTVKYLLVGNRNSARAVPSERAARLTSGTPALSLKQADLDALPIFAPDHEALANALASLESANSAGGSAFGNLHMEVSDGMALLAGNVRFQVEKEQAQESVAGARGVLAVRNEVVTDWDLSIAIAEAVARQGLMRNSLVTVKAYLGDVTLHGYLPSQEQVDQALLIAQSAKGVRSVRESIELCAPDSLQPTTAPEQAAQASDEERPSGRP